MKVQTTQIRVRVVKIECELLDTCESQQQQQQQQHPFGQDELLLMGDMGTSTEMLKPMAFCNGMAQQQQQRRQIRAEVQQMTVSEVHLQQQTMTTATIIQNGTSHVMPCSSTAPLLNSVPLPALEMDINGGTVEYQQHRRHEGSNSSAENNGTAGAKTQPRQRRKVPEGELCAVCSDRATGYHYGVASCNGCKTFFRRTIVSEHSFVCQYSGNCDVTKNVRCACRHCRFAKCVAVGMDAKAIQNDRDRIGPTKRVRLSPGPDGKRSSMDEDQLSLSSLSPQARYQDEKLVEHTMTVEALCNVLRKCVLVENKSVQEALAQPSLIFQARDLPIDERTEFKELYPASMNDIQMWNIRELRLCLEWAKTFEEFQKMTYSDQFALVRHFAFTFNILNRVFYSLDKGPDKIVYPNGAYILRQPQKEVKIPGCRSIYHRQMDEIMMPFRNLEIIPQEFACFKACLFFNPDIGDLSPAVRPEIGQERTKYLSALFHMIIDRHGAAYGVQKYGNLLMMSPSIQNIIDQNEENMQVMEVFGHIWRINGFVKELCMKELK
ncbi:hypothetical protein niasHS_006093 [Heterodera schachtii]|uniref:Uncharacterized protein n=1 Tax=Heterodera schachtii TaxID=97005 RepID=A0ABD2JW47_HETSC